MALALASTPALAQSASAGLLGLLGAFAGLCVGVGMVVAISRSAWVKKALLATGAGALGVFAGFVVGALLGYGIDYARYRNSAFGRSEQMHAEFEQLPLRVAACAADERAVAALIAHALDDDTTRYLGAIAWRCRHMGGEDPAARLRIFTTLMRSVHSLYAGGQRLNDPKDLADPSGLRTADYCRVLDRLAGRIEVEQLAALRAAGLPLRCAGGDSVPSLDTFFQELDYAAAPPRVDMPTHTMPARDRVDALAALIGGPEGLLAQSRSRTGENFLDRTARRYDAHLVEIALGTGADGLSPGPLGKRPALVWAERRLGQCPTCIVPTSLPLGSDIDVAAVDRLMPVPGPRELNAFDEAKYRRPFIFDIPYFQQAPDSGAALLTFAVEHGADLGLAYGEDRNEKVSFLAFYRAEDMKPALICAIEALDTPRFLRLAYPTHPDGHAAIPLLESARRIKNAPLIAVLCRRGIKECSAEEIAAAKAERSLR